MTTIHQCNPIIWVLTPKGEGHAMFLIDYGPNINTIWVVHLFEDGSIIHVDSAEIKICGNEMWDIPQPKPFTDRNI